MIGTPELLILAIIIFVLFGASAIPKFAKSLGQAKKEFTEANSKASKTEDKDKD